MRKYNVAVFGVSGAVGRMMLRVLEEREFPIGTFKLLASSRSAGKSVMFRGEEYYIEETTRDSFQGMDIVLGAVESDIARVYKEDIVKSGAIFIDNSSAFRLEKDVPLVVPQINGDDLCTHTQIIANPNCVTIIALMAVAPLHKEYTIKRMIVSTYQAVSGAGNEGIEALREQVIDPTIYSPIFPYPIAYNVIPQIGSFMEDHQTSEEIKLQREGSKILHAPIEVDCTCVRIPVYTSHS
ncbi:MAG: aspartate-semialdehyde dehydrogenase, partial [Erysipelotrichales bacterium]|nr:aspartate-semialdehyde dehydrogenase [Erysipelotrichales bacterium]